MINYILLGLIITLSIGVVIASESKCSREVRQARWRGMSEGIALMSHVLSNLAQHENGTIRASDIDNATAVYMAHIELERWAEL